MTDGVERHGLSDKGAITPSPNLSEFRVFLYLNTPALVVGEMDMKPVDVMQRQHVKVFFNLVNCEEMTAHVEMHATICEARKVVDDTRRKLYLRGFRANRKTLSERLDALEDT